MLKAPLITASFSGTIEIGTNVETFDRVYGKSDLGIDVRDYSIISIKSYKWTDISRETSITT